MSILDKFLKGIFAEVNLDIPESDKTGISEIDEQEDFNLPEEEAKKDIIRTLKIQTNKLFKDINEYVMRLKSRKVESIDDINAIIYKVDRIKTSIEKLGSLTDSNDSIINIIKDIDQLIEFIQSSTENINGDYINNLLSQLDVPLLELFKVWMYTLQHTLNNTNIKFNDFGSDIDKILLKPNKNIEDIVNEINSYTNELKSLSNIDFKNVDLSSLDADAKKLVDKFKQKYKDYQVLFEKESIQPSYTEILKKIDNIFNSYLDFLDSLTNYTKSKDISEDIENSIQYEKSIELSMFKGALDYLAKNPKKALLYSKVTGKPGVLNNKEFIQTMGKMFLGKAMSESDFAMFEQLLFHIYSNINNTTKLEDTQKDIESTLVFTTVSSVLETTQKFFNNNKTLKTDLLKSVTTKMVPTAFISKKILEQEIVYNINKINNNLIKIALPVATLSINIPNADSDNIFKFIPENKLEELSIYDDYKSIFKESIASVDTFLNDVIYFTDQTMSKLLEMLNTENQDNLNNAKLNTLLIKCYNYLAKDLENYNNAVNRLQKPLSAIERILTNIYTIK